MIPKKNLELIRKSGNFNDLVVAYELNQKEKLENLNIEKEVELLTPAQKESMKDFVKQLLNKKIKPFYGLSERKTTDLVLELCPDMLKHDESTGDFKYPF